MNRIHEIDTIITKKIFNIFSSNKSYSIHKLPYWFGFIPFKYYVEPGIYFALLQIIWLYTYDPLQFHIIPHLIVNGIFVVLYSIFKRKRPGCTYKSMSGHMNKAYCNKKQSYLSFPSLNTSIAFTLLAVFYSEMMLSNNPKFFSFRITEKRNRNIIVAIATISSFVVAIHDMIKGYHYFSDVLVGAILGTIIGLITWQILNIVDKKIDLCENDELVDSNECHKISELKVELITKNKKYIWIEIIIKSILSLIILYLFFNFLRKNWHAKDNKYKI
jgi:membrane-associated phospholipid phosphatase